jgi:hypothetical protein
MSWERAFVATSAALGESADAVRLALGEDGVTRAGDIVRRIREPAPRAARAGAIAEGLALVARDIDEMELTWP